MKKSQLNLKTAFAILAIISIQVFAYGQELFTSEVGKFSINFFDVEPQHSTSSVATELGDVMMSTYIYERGATEAYMVSLVDYPQEKVNEEGSEVLLQGGKSGALESLGIEKIDLERNLIMNGHPGLSFAADNGEYYVLYEMFLVNNRLYQVAILSVGDYPDRKLSDAFFGSFELR